MFPYPGEAGKQYKKPTERCSLRHVHLLIPAAAVLFHCAFKYSYIPPYVMAIFSLLLINVLLLVRRTVELYFGMLSFFVVVLVYAVLSVFSANTALNYLVDSSVVLSVLLTYAYYRYIVETHIVFKQYTPFVVLASTILGVHLGVSHPLRYSLLTALDAIASNVVSVSVENTASKYITSLLFFALLYSSPLVNINLFSLAVFASLHVARNAFMYTSNKCWKNMVGHVLGLDIVLKPLVVAIT